MRGIWDLKQISITATLGMPSSYSHYNDVIMCMVVSQITSLTIVYSTVYSGADQKKHKAPRHWPLYREIIGDR